MSPLLRSLMPGTPCVLWLAILAVCTLTPFASHMISADGDFAGHLTFGRLMLEQGDLLTTDPTSLAAGGRDYVDFEWLSQVLLALAAQPAGPGGAVVLVGLCLATTFSLLLLRLRAEGVGAWTALAVVAFVLLAARVHMMARPHVVTWLLILPFHHLLERFRQGELSWTRWVALTSPLIVLWTNLHGGFVIAAFILGLHGLGELARAALRPDERVAGLRACGGMIAGGVVFLAASLINPWGYRTHVLIVTHLVEPARFAYNAEFQPPDLASTDQWPFLALAAVGVLLLLVASLRRRTSPDPALPTQWVLTLGMLAAALSAARHGPLFALVCAPLIAQRLEDQLRLTALADRPWSALAGAVHASSERLASLEADLSGWVTGAAIGLVIAVAVGVAGVPSVRFDPDRMPVEAADFLADQPRGPVFNTYSWGGYLAHRLYPPTRMFINGQAAVFATEPIEEYDRALRAEPGWRELLDRHGIRWVVLRHGSPLCEALERDPDWAQVHRDPLARVFRRI